MKGRVKFANPLVLGTTSSYFGGIMRIQVLPGGLLGVCVWGALRARRGRFPERLAGKEALGIV